MVVNFHLIRRRAAFAVASVLIAGVTLACKSIPDGAAGPDADALAAKMLAAVNYEAWENKTAAVSWTFRGDRKHFWDKRRGLVEVQWSGFIARFDKNTLQGVVFKDGVRLTEPAEVRKQLAQANAYFVNDAFWLNPLFHIRSPGTQFSTVGANSLKVVFASGGVTPGDTYVFHVDESGLVQSMQLWVSVLPVKGASAVFENYAVSETGVKTALKYDFLVTVEIGDVRMYPAYPDKKGDEDRFSDLAGLAN